jgi:hypothetical protein
LRPSCARGSAHGTNNTVQYNKECRCDITSTANETEISVSTESPT